jgi:NADPH:quinone reductase-like Zn-dependent oxidoreductase
MQELSVAYICSPQRSAQRRLVVPAAGLAVVPDRLDLVSASTLPLNGLAAAQIVDRSAPQPPSEAGCW